MLFETLYIERFVLNGHKIGNVLYISIKITLSCRFALLAVCLNFQTNLANFAAFIFIAISLGASFISGHNVVTILATRPNMC